MPDQLGNCGGVAVELAQRFFGQALAQQLLDQQVLICFIQYVQRQPAVNAGQLVPCDKGFAATNVAGFLLLQALGEQVANGDQSFFHFGLSVVEGLIVAQFSVLLLAKCKAQTNKGDDCQQGHADSPSSQPLMVGRAMTTASSAMRSARERSSLASSS